jgi:hypothetical protein
VKILIKVELSKKRWDDRSKAGWSAKKLLENWNANEKERLQAYEEKQNSIQENIRMLIGLGY